MEYQPPLLSSPTSTILVQVKQFLSGSINLAVLIGCRTTGEESFSFTVLDINNLFCTTKVVFQSSGAF